MEKNSSSVSPDIKLVTIDVKMQIRTLLAVCPRSLSIRDFHSLLLPSQKVLFLLETGGMTAEIERMMSELTGLCNKRNYLPTLQPPNPSATAHPPKLLLEAERLRAHSEYLGPNWPHLLIIPGDIIDVYAYIDKTTAVGFNTRTDLGGRFPIDIAKRVESQPYKKAEILFCTSGKLNDKSSPTSLAYTSGQYLRICKREKDRGWAYGFNQSTLAMGRFDTRYSFKKVEWHDET